MSEGAAHGARRAPAGEQAKSAALCRLAIGLRRRSNYGRLAGLRGRFGAVLIPQGFGIVRSVFPREEMPLPFGAFAPALGLSSWTSSKSWRSATASSPTTACTGAGSA